MRNFQTFSTNILFLFQARNVGGDNREGGSELQAMLSSPSSLAQHQQNQQQQQQQIQQPQPSGVKCADLKC